MLRPANKKSTAATTLTSGRLGPLKDVEAKQCSLQTIDARDRSPCRDEAAIVSSATKSYGALRIKREHRAFQTLLQHSSRFEVKRLKSQCFRFRWPMSPSQVSLYPCLACQQQKVPTIRPCVAARTILTNPQLGSGPRGTFWLLPPRPVVSWSL